MPSSSNVPQGRVDATGTPHQSEVPRLDSSRSVNTIADGDFEHDDPNRHSNWNTTTAVAAPNDEPEHAEGDDGNNGEIRPENRHNDPQTAQYELAGLTVQLAAVNEQIERVNQGGNEGANQGASQAGDQGRSQEGNQRRN